MNRLGLRGHNLVMLRLDRGGHRLLILVQLIQLVRLLDFHCCGWFWEALAEEGGGMVGFVLVGELQDISSCTGPRYHLDQETLCL